MDIEVNVGEVICLPAGNNCTCRLYGEGDWLGLDMVNGKGRIGRNESRNCRVRARCSARCRSAGGRAGTGRAVGEGLA